MGVTHWFYPTQTGIVSPATGLVSLPNRTADCPRSKRIVDRGRAGRPKRYVQISHLPMSYGLRNRRRIRVSLGRSPKSHQGRSIRSVPTANAPADRFRFGLGKVPSVATSLARPMPWVDPHPRAARTFVALTYACPGLRNSTLSAYTAQ